MVVKTKKTGAKKKVLVVDDELAIREWFQEICCAMNLDVHLAASGEEALGLFAKNRYDLIILDCAMPGMDGLDLHTRLSHLFGFGKRVSPLLPQRLPPILVVTAWADDESVQNLIFGERVVGIMQKPVEYEKFVRVIDDLLAWESFRKERRAKALSRLGKKIERPFMTQAR